MLKGSISIEVIVKNEIMEFIIYIHIILSFILIIIQKMMKWDFLYFYL